MRILAATMLLLAAAAAAGRARADVAGTGTLELSVIPGATAGTVALDGTLVFDPGARTALGRSVDLAASLGETLLAGEATVAAGGAAPFTLEGEDEEAELGFTVAGTGRCTPPACAGGTAALAGRLEVTADAADVLPDGLFTLDASVALDAQGTGTGRVAVNAFPLVALAAGTDVSVASGAQRVFDPVTNGERGFTARATFATVTAPGAAGFLALSTRPGALPAGVGLEGTLSVLVVPVVEAVVTGPVTLCLGWQDTDRNGVVDGTGVAVAQVRLLAAPAADAAFADVTDTVADGFACGTTAAPEPVVLGVAGPIPTTTTVTAPSASTSTSASTSSTATSTSVPATTTTSSTLPSCTSALECLEQTIARPLCPGEPLDARLSTAILRRLTRAQLQLLRARDAGSPRRVLRLAARARRQLAKVAARADAFVSRPKGAISAACRDNIRAALDRVARELAASRI